jgi:hypothetical protein
VAGPRRRDGHGQLRRRPLAEGLSCDPSAGSLSGYDRDLRGHSSLIDLNGDGATDYAWVYYPDDPNSPWPLPTTVTHGFFSNGRQFGNNSATTASGETLGAFDLLSRAYVPTDWDAVVSSCGRATASRTDHMVDLDGDAASISFARRPVRTRRRRRSSSKRS